jgi:hypothetical protein
MTSLGELATPIYQGGLICTSRGKTASLALFTKSRVDSHDGTAMQRRFVLAEINISQVDSHDGDAMQRRVVLAEIYSETDINITKQSTPIAQNKLINEWGPAPWMIETAALALFGPC